MEYDIEQLEEYFKQLDLYLADLEKAGAFLLSLGYSLYIKSAQVDILEVLNEDFEPVETPREILVTGQRLILFGYIILYSVARQRLQQKIIMNEVSEEPVNLSPYRRVIESYFVSVIANYVRLNAFIDLTGEEVIV